MLYSNLGLKIKMKSIQNMKFILPVCVTYASGAAIMSFMNSWLLTLSDILVGLAFFLLAHCTLLSLVQTCLGNKIALIS